MELRYEVIIYWSKEDDCFLAEVPELGGCMTDGKTYQEALKNAQEVMEIWIEIATEKGWDIPEPKGKLMYA